MDYGAHVSGAMWSAHSSECIDVVAYALWGHDAPRIMSYANCLSFVFLIEKRRVPRLGQRFQSWLELTCHILASS